MILLMIFFHHLLLSKALNRVYRLHVKRIKKRKLSASSNTVGGILRHLGARRKSNDAKLECELIGLNGWKNARACFRRQSNMDADGCTARVNARCWTKVPTIRENMLRKNIICGNRSAFGTVPVVLCILRYTRLIAMNFIRFLVAYVSFCLDLIFRKSNDALEAYALFFI